LEMRDINWHTCEITLIQSKTDYPIHMPLLPDVGNAVAYYILHARPESKSCKIFLRSNSPFNALSAAGNGRHTINRYLEKAGIDHKAFDGKTFHAVRRTFGTHLLETGVPLHSVAQLLGHISIESAKRYISLNDTMLRMCCLGISEYATRKEGLV
jgi:site-specific recombinase XerD